ncbi:PH domain-containing protein [Alkalicoccobacillus porphyridii]|uniref:PH domain-containing protein n=1 Tax=Alkalicoccobacillus porphyridii TaxID=2597270 RepID=A0A553ZZW5_9BACI|nr:PH domain-containing protein [Alkalicoccobacillus porphyridii]TSB46972.1 PH domain-containing protein [Alkalicoccobacillus porphyridii]
MNNLKRLHPSALLISFLTAVKNAIIPIIAIFFISSDDSHLRFAWIAILALTIISSVLTWLTFYYRLQEGQLYIQKGIFVKKKKYIQKQRVQSIDITAGVLQRLFGMVSVEIETAGGGPEAEARLTAVTKAEAEAIRKELLERRSELKTEDEHGEIEQDQEEQSSTYVPEKTWELGTERLIAMALTSSGVGLIFSAVGALFGQFYQFIPNNWLDNTFGFVTQVGFSMVLAFIGIAFLALLVSWALSSVFAIIKYGGFKIEHFGKELVISRGLLERRQLTLQLNRITSVRLVQNILRQPLGFVSVYVESAGGGTKDEQASTLLIPLVKKSDLHTVLAEILPDYSFEKQYTSLPQRALWRLLVRYTAFPIIITGVAIYFFSPFGYLGILLIALCAMLAWLTYKAGGSGSYQDFMYIRYRTFSLIEVMAPRWKVQAAETSESFLQSWQGLATYKVTVQSSISGKAFFLSDLSREEGDRMLQWYSYAEKKDEL